MKRDNLRYGYTTGACAAAAAGGAALMLRDQRPVPEVEIVLPGGDTARFTLRGRQFDGRSASCHVIKDAGDDPDVTNGAEIHGTVALNPHRPPFHKGGGAPIHGCSVVIEGGIGVGRVTKPGLAVPVGGWAINPVPRRMIEDAVSRVFSLLPPPLDLRVVISVPNGEELAKRTLNARLGIVGGLSILGTTGIVRPISADAWTGTIETAIDVALACGSPFLVLSTGRTSEVAAQSRLSRDDLFASAAGTPRVDRPLAEEAFIMMGDHVGFALTAALARGATQVVIAAQFAKLLKIACGHRQTHVNSSGLDLRMLADWLRSLPGGRRLIPLVEGANTARQVLESSGNDPALVELVCGRALESARRIAPGLDLKVLLAGYGGEVLYYGSRQAGPIAVRP